MSERRERGSTAKAKMAVRTMRLRARAPRMAFYVLVAIFSLAGLRAVLEPPPEPARATRPERSAKYDRAAESFAEAFARAYLTWDDSRPDEREQRLAAFLPTTLDADGGLAPADGSTQEVSWTTVAGSRRQGRRTMVTVTAATSDGTVHLSVPVERDERGFLYVSGYPALVGPPATNREAMLAAEDSVEDEKLTVVVERAVTNYLARARGNLLADLTPDAVVSLPAEPLDVTGVDEVTWVTPGRRVAVQLDAEDDQESTWTLRYELEVRKSDRWYVRSLQMDPTFQGGQ